ncbi:helix-turn-helix domain-containing protein [Pinibacter aurantiacus]|uniref:Helix-turn-helix domain-containing protein n=1 Tax=Pinibacter aurantiacus TaxID=2851599 RepID=A0A9E2S5T6_9BACT|nr:helix-turn-helix transcriptional regulator [Pinibacter aurantiacus]MBV4356306.1 helix-turn-helix domain-containing protein [Pinibacter aurantiacus]
MKALGKRIKDLRNVQGFSQEDLAYEADIPLSQVGRIERGEINPTISTLAAIATALRVELKEIFNFKY